MLVINCSPVKTGATAAIVHLVTEQLSAHYPTKSICIDDYTFRFCQGCRTCHHTAKCVIEDDVTAIMDEWEQADIIVSVAPSYWAELPGQFKAFIDRCTPWCDTHEPHASLRKGKKGYAIVLRTGSGMKECDRLVQSLEHFYGHLVIECSGHLRLCSVAGKEDVPAREEELITFCRRILSKQRTHRNFFFGRQNGSADVLQNRRAWPETASPNHSYHEDTKTPASKLL